ncbi:helix-turn-helix domain-containing protein [Sphaerisporangium dianthi]|uniref:Helix-turn-helix domain-containing protein n=1 Tax=Sphaerisporangium dianthi TaxID=1436120 RepID=A0ABV9CVM1_9ACTN
MRHAQGGGLSAERRAFRERLRLQAAERFARDESSTAIARDPRISLRSVQRWKRDWRAGGAGALRSHGPVSLLRLGERQLAALEQELRKGPVRHGWPGR